MKVSIKKPMKTYPYLAIWTGGSEGLSKQKLENIELADIVLISMVSDDEKTDKKTYVQYLLGGKKRILHNMKMNTALSLMVSQ